MNHEMVFFWVWIKYFIFFDVVNMQWFDVFMQNK